MRKQVLTEFHKNHRLVGGYLPLPVAEQLTMYCTYTEQSRSALIGSLLKNELMNAPTEDEMAKHIANQVLLYRRKRDSVERCLTQLRHWLITKNFTDEQIALVVTHAKEILNGKKTKTNNA